MLVRYKRNKQIACYDSNSLVTAGKIPPDERLHGPFQSCGNCPYPSHGFIYYSSEGDCLRTDMQRLHNKHKDCLIEYKATKSHRICQKSKKHIDLLRQYPKL